MDWLYMYMPIAGVTIFWPGLVLIGFSVGVIGGFFGMGGAWMVTRATGPLHYLSRLHEPSLRYEPASGHGGSPRFDREDSPATRLSCHRLSR